MFCLLIEMKKCLFIMRDLHITINIKIWVKFTPQWGIISSMGYMYVNLLPSEV